MIITTSRDDLLKPFLNLELRGTGTVQSVRTSGGHIFFCVTDIKARSNGHTLAIDHLNLAIFSWMHRMKNVGEQLQPGQKVKFSGMVAPYCRDRSPVFNAFGLPKLSDIQIV